MKKKGKIVLISVVSATLVIVITVGILLYVLLSKDAPPPLDIKQRNFTSLWLPPENVEIYELLDIPDETDLEANKELAVYLYNLANKKDKEIEYRVFNGTCPAINNTSFGGAGGMDNIVDLEIVEMKNGSQFLRTDYRLKSSIPFFEVSPSWEKSLNEKLELVLSERSYVDSTKMDVLKYQKVTNAKLDENNIPYADWSVLKEEVDRPIPVYRAEQEGDYVKCEHKIAADTITDAKIIYDAELEIYRVELVLDTDNPDTTAVKKPNIESGTGDPNARFTSITVMFEVFRSGHFRYFEWHETFAAKVASFISITADFYYKDIYSYGYDDCNINLYKDAYDYKVALGLAD